MNRLWAVPLAIAWVSNAAAGGFTFPDVGAESMGRGGAFTAKADSPLALEYNVAGLAQQRSTCAFLVDTNLVWNAWAFAPADGSPRAVDTGASPTVLPFAGVTCGFKKKWTLGFASHFDPSIGQRVFGVEPSAPAGTANPARYDALRLDWQLLHNTLAAAYRVTDYLDIGIGLDVMVGWLQYHGTLISPQGDEHFSLATSGQSAAAMAGVLVRPRADLVFGANVRSQTILRTRGKGALFATGDLDATMETELPWILRVGARYVCTEDHHEVMDLEVDGTYEAWGQVEDAGDKITIGSGATPLTWQTPRHYRDTYSVRAGGAYNFYFQSGSALSLRLGAFYASSATKPANTRVDFDTLEKFGLTAGLGVHLPRGFVINVAYSYMYEPDRTVSDGAIAPINAATGDSVGLAAINNGTYTGSTHQIALGLIFAIDAIAGKPDYGAEH